MSAIVRTYVCANKDCGKEFSAIEPVGEPWPWCPFCGASSRLKSVLEVASIYDKLDRIRDLHKPFYIYDECGHKHQEGDEGVTDVDDVGLVCKDGLIYAVCSACCLEYGRQTETCAGGHKHGTFEPICATAEILQ